MADALEIAAAESGSLADFIDSGNQAERIRKGKEPDPLETAAPAAAAAVEAPSVPAETAAPPDAATEPAKSDEIDELDEQPRDAAGKFVEPTPAWLQKRINRAVAKQKEAERRAEQAERELQTARAQPQAEKPVPPPQPTGADPRDPKPDPDYFNSRPNEYPDPYISYAEAIGAWSARQESRRIQQVQAEQTATQQFREAVSEVKQLGQEKYADYDEKIAAQPLNFPNHVIATLVDEALPAVVRADIVYYLSTHANEARALAQAPPHVALLTLGQLSTRFSAAQSNGSAEKAPTRSKAKPLIQPVSASAPTPSPNGSVENAEHLSLADYNRIENAAERRRRELRG